MPRSKRVKELLKSDKRSRTLLVIHIAAAFGFFLIALVFYKLGLRFPPCPFNLITGGYCLTCGATRAMLAIVNFQFLRSLLLNPVPLMLALFMLFVMLHELVNAVNKKNKTFKYFLICSLIIIFVAVIFCLLRNFGVIPPPNLI